MTGEIVSVLFTDLVGSTDLADRLGDAGAETVRRTHFKLLRDGIGRHGGHEVKNLGDGLMVVFASAVDAVDAAIAIQRATAEHNAAGVGIPIQCGWASTSASRSVPRATISAPRSTLPPGCARPRRPTRSWSADLSRNWCGPGAP